MGIFGVRRPDRTGPRSILAVSLLVGGLAIVAAPSGVASAESAGCAALNDPASGFNGQNAGGSVTGLEFALNDRIFIVADAPASDDALGQTLTVNGFRFDRLGLPTASDSPAHWVEAAGVVDIAWTVFVDPASPNPDDATVTWTVSCDPGPIISVEPVCLDTGGFVRLNIDDPDQSSYSAFVAGTSTTLTVDAPGVNSFDLGPLSDGTYEIVVEPTDDLRLEFVWESVTLDCSAGVTSPTPTSAAPSTAVPTSAPATSTPATAVPTSQASQAVTVPPTSQAPQPITELPETGPVSTRSIVLAALCLVLAGTALLSVRRPARRAS